MIGMLKSPVPGLLSIDERSDDEKNHILGRSFHPWLALKGADRGQAPAGGHCPRPGDETRIPFRGRTHRQPGLGQRRQGHFHLREDQPEGDNHPPHGDPRARLCGAGGSADWFEGRGHRIRPDQEVPIPFPNLSKWSKTTFSLKPLFHPAFHPLFPLRFNSAAINGKANFFHPPRLELFRFFKSGSHFQTTKLLRLTFEISLTPGLMWHIACIKSG